MNRIAVLGAGMIGSAIASDLSDGFAVTLADLDPVKLSNTKTKCPQLETRILNFKDHPVLREFLRDFDFAVLAVPGFMGFETLRQVILSGTSLVDISFFPEDPFELNELARENGVTAIVDCGIAPGLSNVLIGHHDTLMRISDYECLVGGLPRLQEGPFKYKSPFSPVDVIEEYMRPARQKENGVEVVKEPLSECEYSVFDEAGILEAFNTDGLRTLLTTMPHIPNLKEKTLRYPGHAEYMQVLKDSGFFGKDPISVNGNSVRPFDVTCEILFHHWKPDEFEDEMTLLRVTMEGVDGNDQKKRVVYNLSDVFDHASGLSSMARTTGFTASAAMRLLAKGTVKDKGILPPEFIGRIPGGCDSIVNYLKGKGINISMKEFQYS